MVSRRPWSRVTNARSDVGCFCSSSTGASIGLISRSNRPSAQACLALLCDWKPHSSMSSRVMPRRLAIRSAAVNWSGRSMSHDSGRSTERSGPALAPSPIALIASMPQAMPTSMAPAAIEPGDQVVGLLPAAALAVHGGGADVFRQTRDQPCRPG